MSQFSQNRSSRLFACALGEADGIALGAEVEAGTHGPFVNERHVARSSLKGNTDPYED